MPLRRVEVYSPSESDDEHESS
jgi:hypothetical protein